jgi:hypothetical protein
MNTSTIQLWLHEAQWRLPQEKGAVHDILCEGIKAAATELLFRYCQDKPKWLADKDLGRAGRAGFDVSTYPTII